MRRRRFLLQTLLGLAAALGLAEGACAGVSASPDVGNLIDIQERGREALFREAERYNEEARQRAQQSQGLLGQLNGLRREAVEAQAQVERLEREGERLRGQAAALDQDIAGMGTSLSALTARLRGRVVDMYKYSPREGMNILLSSMGPHDALTAAYMLGRLVRQDQELIQDLMRRSSELAQSRAALEESQVQVRRQAAELREKHAELNTAVRRTDALLKDIRGQQRKAEAAARELTQAQRELGERILALRRQRGGSGGQGPSPASPVPAQPDAPPRQVEQPVQSVQEEKPAPTARRPQSYTYLPKGAALEWPVRGAVAVPFGSRLHPVFRTKMFNSGIDIKAASGTPVRAAGPGEVLFRGWLRGFGQVVIIDHGGELSTVYAHLATTAVEEGDAVRTGNLLGTAGNSGTNTEAGLHFEVRRGGTAQDPLNYLRKI